MSAELLFEDYKVKLDYLRGQYDRLWQRFNFFLGVELAVFGFLGYLTFNLKLPGASVLPASIGLVISALWYVVGAQDRWLVEVYRQRARDAAVRFAEGGGQPGFERDHAAADVPAGWQAVRSWYWSPLSITKLPATFGLLMAATWLVILFAWRPAVGELVMMSNKTTVESYMDAFRRTDRAQILSLLTDDVEWTIPGLFHVVGKEAFNRHIVDEGFADLPAIDVSRLTEENDVVVAEGTVRAKRTDGTVANLAFCDVFEMRRGKIRRLISYLMETR